MAKKSSKKFQLIITGYNYDKGTYPSKVTLVTKEDIESLKPLFEAISKNTESYNWTSQTTVIQNKFGGWDGHLSALYEMYPQFKDNNKFEVLVINTFPNNGKTDSISRIEINELKNIETFTF